MNATSSPPEARHTPWLFAFALVAALCTLGLIGIGGLVTSHGVGLAVPDWPNTYGYNMFLFPISQWTGGIFYEHTHRLFASFVGLLTVGLAVALALKDGRRWMKRLGALAVVLVVFQGVLGGLRVVWLKDEIGIFHAALAQLFLMLMSALALWTSRWWMEGAGAGRPGVIPGGTRKLVGLATALILVQLILGASMRHQHAGLAVPDFPLAHGAIWPATDAASLEAYNRSRHDVWDYHPVTAGQIWLHMAHRLAALGIVVLAAWAAWRSRGAAPWLRRGVVAWLGLILLQAGLGAATVWTNKAADVATLHVVLGASSLAAGALLSLGAWKFSIEAAGPLGHSAADLSDTRPSRAKPAWSAGGA